MKNLNPAGIAAFLALSCLNLSVNVPASVATQQLFCNGRMQNGWSYQAEFVDGRFTRIRWTRSGQPPQVSPLTFKRTNDKGQPIYRGGLFAAVTVTLVDLSKGEVAPGSQVSVNVEEWGWSRATCGVSPAR
ncbi:hypothetical protein V0288_21205 [Pannus brasiliensis CCIBt3594]|uniref:Uncharacterized protein n=1 Tax=Pannus brasiliensis CCIBt3594 TaxID=1427578 RepID=A0AAW9R167_9CHRO